MPTDWVVLELSLRGESEDPDEISKSILRVIGGEGEVFIPASITQIGEDRVVRYLMDGYAFVRRDHEDAAYLKLEGSRYVQSLLAEGNGKDRRLSTVTDADVERLKRQVRIEADQGICIGDTVEIVKGPYQSIPAQVVADIPEQGKVQVYVQLRSKQSLLTLPRTFLKVIERAPGSPMAHHVSRLREWLMHARPYLTWEDQPLLPLKEAWGDYSRFADWQFRGCRLWSLVANASDALVVHCNSSMAEFEQLGEWVVKGRRLWSFVTFYQTDFLGRKVAGIENVIVELAWMQGVLERFQRLVDACDRLAQQVAQLDGGDVTQNVIVDGMNLAYRCLHAPNLKDLTDELGRPTGVIFGFLRGLGSLRKRYPNARLYVAWDAPGSSQSRKDAFPGYKAKRQSRMSKFSSSDRGFNQIDYLMEILPALGVYQGINPEAEADDVIATLTRDHLKGQVNVVFSTDNDLLQLVTLTTHVLQPAVGGRKELEFTSPADVEKLFGVLPSSMVQLRALCGDTSDEIPGVARVPKKVLRDLVRTHGTVEGVFKSGLAGLSGRQYEQLQTAKPQVTLNVELMTLQNVTVFLTNPDEDVDRIASRLREIGVNPDPILDALLGPRIENGSIHHSSGPP